MAHIHNLPEEVLAIIFKLLTNNSLRVSRDLQQVQRVCQAWYVPAHTLLLEYTEFLSDDEVEGFIARFDQTSNPVFFKGVKELCFVGDDLTGLHPESLGHDGRIYDAETLKKLFFRFPNLQTVDISDFEGLCENFDDDLCEEFIQCCPKLNTFKYWIYDEDKEDRFFATLWKLRLLVTFLELDLIEPALERHGNTFQYLTSFPRLRTIDGYSYRIGNFFFMLRLLDKLKYVSAININSEADDEEHFVEMYFKRKSRAEQDAIVERLSNVKKLQWICDIDTGLGLHSTMFITKYLTGLETFELTSHSNLRWSDSHIAALSNNIVDLVLSMKEKGRVDLRQLEITSLTRCLPIVMQKMFANTTKSKRLHVIISSRMERDLVGLDFAQEQKQLVTVWIDNEKSLDEIMPYVFPQDIPTLNGIDEFALHIIKKSRPHYDQVTNADMYSKLIERMPSLKKVELDVPESFDDTNSMRPTEVQEHAGVEELVLQATDNATFKQLLDRCFVSFPNLKKLNLQYFCGAWNEDKKEFQVELPKYSLQNLKIDMTPVKKAIKQLVETKPSMKKDSFVIEVEILNNSIRHLYEVALDLSSVTRIMDNDLYGYTRGENYVRVHVSIKSVQSIDICLCHYYTVFEDVEPNYIHDNMKYVNIYNN